jgi:hypothetical protein
MSATRNASIFWRREFREPSRIGKRASPEVAKHQYTAIQHQQSDLRPFIYQLCAIGVRMAKSLSPQVSLCAFNTLAAQPCAVRA